MKGKIVEEPLFYPAPFFMVRTPLLPVEDFLSQLRENDPHSKFDEDELIREAIMIGSPKLYQALKEKKATQSSSSLSNYLNRMSTRATPFGLFSCISVGEWGENASTFLDFEQIYKRARPDMQWLSLVIDQICKDPSLFALLSVKRNELLYESGGRVFLKYLREKQGVEKRKTSSIRLSFLTKAIFEFAQLPIAVKDLKAKLILVYPSLEMEKLDGVIQKLLEEQFLDFDLRPSLLSESPFKEFLIKLAPIASTALLDEIADQIQSYNLISVGRGEKKLEYIQQLMGKIASSPKNYLQVDTACAGKNVVLPKNVISELQKSVELLWRISCIEPDSPLESYHKKFLDKYGVCRLVPLIELLSEEIGLGIPEHYANPSSGKLFKNDSKGKKWNEWLENQWANCLWKRSQEIEIDEKIILELNEKLSKETALLSFDLRCEIIANNPEEIDRGEFLLQIEPFAWQGGATFGRFVDLLGNQTKERLQSFFREEEAIDGNSLFIESSFEQVNSSRSSNVMIQPNLRNDSIDLVGTGTISLSEIYIGANADRLYLTQKEGVKELRVASGNMFNPSYAPIPLRLIRDISLYKYHLISPFSWGRLTNVFFFPRIRYRKTILSPAQWKIDLFQLTCTTRNTIENLESRFSEWADTWQLPRYLLMSKEDNRLLLDRKHPPHLREIALQLKKGKKVHLIEKIGQVDKGLIQSQKGSHYAEFIIPFLKSKKYSLPMDSNQIPLIKYHSIPADSRWKLPGSEWLFVKYYLGSENENRFLIEHCYRYVSSLLERGIIKGWFFVRYADPKTHLRLRFCCKEEYVYSQLIPEIYKWASTLIENQVINEMSLSTYEREIERYGGVALIEATEVLFCGDTETTLALIRAVSEKKTILVEEVLAALSMIDLLRQLGLNLKDQLSFFSSLAMSKDELSGFRKWKNPLLSISHAIFENNLEAKSDVSFLHTAFQKRTHSVKAYTMILRETEEKQGLTTSLYNIYDSIVHMHCNRLIGRSGNEKKARLYAYHTLTLIQEKQKTHNWADIHAD